MPYYARNFILLHQKHHINEVQGKHILILLGRENRGCGDEVTEIDSDFLNKIVIFSLYCEKFGVCVYPDTVTS